MKKFCFRALFLGLCASFLTGCFHSSPEEKAEWIENKIGKKLELDEQQKVKLGDVVDAVMEFRKQRKERRAELKDQVIGFVKDEDLQLEEVQSLVRQEVEQIKPDILAIGEKVVLLQRSLTPEQRNKVAEFIEKHHARRHR